MAAAKAAGLTLKSADDLEIVEGIGPKIAELLREAGIITFMQLAQSTPARIRDILDKSGPNFRIANPDTWPEQAELAARNRWKALHALQSVLTAGVRSNGGGSGSGSTGASAAAAHTEETAQLKAQLAERDAEIKRLRVGPTIDLGAAKAAGFNLKGPDDLEIIEGIGPKIAELLVAGGIDTFTRLAVSTPQQIQDTLDRAGPHFRLAKAETWPEQADLAAHNRWRALASLQKMLIAGNRE